MNDKKDVMRSTIELYRDIDNCITNIVAARVKRDKQALSDAHWAMEGLMVAAQQQLTFLTDYIEANVKE